MQYNRSIALYLLAEKRGCVSFFSLFAETILMLEIIFSNTCSDLTLTQQIPTCYFGRIRIFLDHNCISFAFVPKLRVHLQYVIKLHDNSIKCIQLEYYLHVLIPLYVIPTISYTAACSSSNYFFYFMHQLHLQVVCMPTIVT